MATIVMVLLALWQRWSGPTYPRRGTIGVGGATVRVKLIRTHGGPEAQPVRIVAPDTAIGGRIAWRRYPTDEPWQVIPLARTGDTLAADLPHQPPAGKLAYRVTLRRGSTETTWPIALWYAFGQWWEGIPLGWDLTDNKTLIAGLAWLWALVRTRGGRESRSAILAASMVTLAVFAVPHSLFGSQIDWGGSAR